MAVNRRSTVAALRQGLFHRSWAHRLFHRMLARQGIRVEAAGWPDSEPLLFRAFDCCRRCPVKEACRAWLASSDAPASYLSFCPNSETIEALRIAQR